MSQYGTSTDTSTVTVTNGSATIIGATSLWLANAAPTNLFVALGIAGEDVAYEIASVDDDVTIQLTAPFAGTSGGTRAYTIHRDFRPIGLPVFSRNDVAVHAILNRWSAELETIIGSGGNAVEIDDLTVLAQADLDPAADRLIIHDDSVDEAKQFLVGDLPAGTPADDSINYVKLNTDAKRLSTISRSGSFAPNQSQADANAYQDWSAGTLTVNSLAEGSSMFGVNSSGGPLPVANGSASITLGPAQVLAGEPWLLVWNSPTAVHLLTRV